MLSRLTKLALLLASCSLVPLANAAEWYVVPSGGDDANDCTLTTSPCSSIEGVTNKAAFTAGDIIYLQQGTYDINASQATISKAAKVYGGYTDDTFTTRLKDPAKTILTNSNTSASRIFNINTGHNEFMLFDGVQISGLNSTDPAIGTIITGGSGAWLQFNNVLFKDNTADYGGAINAGNDGDRIFITNSTFSNNTADRVTDGTGDGGAIRAYNLVELDIRDTIFDNNSATRDGGAMRLSNGVQATMTNVTFYNNYAGGRAGSIYLIGTSDVSSMRCVHCTIVANTSGTSSAKNVSANGAYASLYFKNSYVVNNIDSGDGANIHLTASATLENGGYNAWGINNVADFNFTVPVDKGSFIVANVAVSELFEANIDYNGGTVKSLKPVPTSPLIDVIPNDAPTTQVGEVPSTPFTSIADAYGGMKFFELYTQGYYYFNLNGQTFRTWVDNDGWVLIASTDGLTAPATLAIDTNIGLQTNEILPAAALAEMDISEVRITAPDSKLGNYDMRTFNPDIITELKAYNTLPNNFDLFGAPSSNPFAVWYGTHWLNMANATCTDLGKGFGDLLNQNILGHCGDPTQGFHWQESRADVNGPQKTVTWATKTPYDSMNLWVRSEAVGNCNGSTNTDQRGLPRPDFVNPEDPNQYGDIRDCDIGSFEWSNGYRLDCFEEDGDRPESTPLTFVVSFCVSDINSITPKGVIDNVGYIHWQWLLLMSALLLFRITAWSQSGQRL